ncbi:response regulator [Pseudonocardia sp. GCM10023141]|uniref:response regulator n=1 Tax=Pseudonocardia sp. GCM10023141 TaxID=3252653 RepID=UPI00360B9A8E
MVIAIFEVARRRGLRISAIACGIAAAAATVAVRLVHEVDAPAVLTLAWTGWIVLPWVLGALVHVMIAGRDRARRELVARVALEERMAIAGEVHDVAGHGFAVVAMQAGARCCSSTSGPSRPARRSRRSGPPVRPRSRRCAPCWTRSTPARRPAGLVDVEELVDRVRAGGLPVDLTVAHPEVPVAPDVDVVAFRVVQESLTNVLRHAGPTRAEVRIGRGDGRLLVQVDDRGVGADGAVAGRGLTGMRTRVEAVGGRFAAGPRPGGGFSRDRSPAGGRPMIRVALADDHELVRMGLRVLVEREADMCVVGEASSGRAALELVHRERPDVLLLDIRMPGMDGLEVLRGIAAEPAPADVHVVVVTTFEIDQYIFEALQAGAAGLILKDTAPEELVRAIRVVAAGEALLSPSVTRRVVSLFARQAAADPAPVDGLDDLTDREREVVAWVSTGRSDGEIARELFLSPDTVRTHVSRAMGKVHAHTRAQLVVVAVLTASAPATSAVSPPSSWITEPIDTPTPWAPVRLGMPSGEIRKPTMTNSPSSTPIAGAHRQGARPTNSMPTSRITMPGGG